MLNKRSTGILPVINEGTGRMPVLRCAPGGMPTQAWAWHPTCFAVVAMLVFCALAPIALAQAPKPAAPKAPPPKAPLPKPEVLSKALQGPLRNVEEVVFTSRNIYSDPHWYANIGYWSEDENKVMWAPGGSRLSKLNLRTKQITHLIDDKEGTLRDCSVHYDGKKVLFSWRKGGTKYFNLYEMGIDGKNLRQTTSGPWDDIEACYLPNDDIVFVSTRAKRWVSCWYTQVAIMHRCDKDGKNIRSISGNIEQDNTPAVMPDGRLLYTRWEYVDRSQVDYHHLWTANPDGTGVQTWFGNLHASIVMIDAKPIPGTGKVAAVYSHGHGRSEHIGDLRIVSPDAGPDAREQAAVVPGCPTSIHDPYVFSESLFLVARKNDLVLVDAASGTSEIIHTDAMPVHEPAAIMPRARERVIPDRADPAKANGKLILANVYEGRNMDGVKPGDIKKLLVLEALPKPVNFSGGPEPITYLGTFNIERVVGTVPVEPDGSAFLELPANRSMVLVALDEKDLSVKRMQSFVSVMPGETTSCIGCHEQRYQTTAQPAHLMATKRSASKIEPFAGIPDVIDFPRDVQPILNQHCVKCHSYDKPDGGFVLEGDRGTMYSQAYWSLIAGNQVADGRNGYGNQPPRTIGSSASKLMKKIDGSHYNVKLDAKQWRTIWMWIESGATYSGTYAALASGMSHASIPSQVYAKRCASCHAPETDGKDVPGKVGLPANHGKHTRTAVLAPHERVVGDNDPQLRRGSRAIYNLTRPEKSFALLAPLAKDAGGWQACKELKPDGTYGAPVAVFKNTNDPDYQATLQRIREGAAHLNQIRRFDMPGFKPNAQYVREMKRYGILPAAFDVSKDPIDVFAIDQAYWKSLWWKPTTDER